MPVTPLRPADPEVVGPHRLLGRLGQGGMGTVYLGVSPDERAVAVKVLRDSPLAGPGDGDARRRFRQELEVLRRVRGPHLVEVLDADVDADLPYLVTRFVPGRRLDDLVAESGPLDDDALRLLARGVADALTTLHKAGVVHRDLTPGNVLVLDGSPQVIDLGLAVAADITAQTRTGLVVGTPGYLAPEQVTGREVGPAVDVHAWGATVALAGTGRPPFGTGRPEAVLYRIVHEEPDLDGLPADLADLVEQAMSADPADRPTAVQLLSRLGGASSAETVVVHLPRDVDATTVLGGGPGGRADRPLDRTRVDDLGWREAGTLLGARPAAPLQDPATVAVTRPAPPDAPTVPVHRPAAAPLQPALAAAPVLRSVPQEEPYSPPYDGRHEAGPYDQHDQHDPYDQAGPDDQHGPYDQDPDGGDDVTGPYDAGPDAAVEAWAQEAERLSSARSLQLVVTAGAALAVVATGALVAPVLTGIAVLAGVVVMRAAGRSAERLALRRDRRGERRRDPVVSVLGLPWHLLTAAVDTLVSAPLLAVSAAVPAGIVWLADPVVDGLERPELTASTAIVVALAVCLARRGHTRTRVALRRTLLAATPSTAAAVAVIAVLLVSALLLLAAAEGSAPTWWPAQGLVADLQDPA